MILDGYRVGMLFFLISCLPHVTYCCCCMSLCPCILSPFPLISTFVAVALHPPVFQTFNLDLWAAIHTAGVFPSVVHDAAISIMNPAAL